MPLSFYLQKQPPEVFCKKRYSEEITPFLTEQLWATASVPCLHCRYFSSFLQYIPCDTTFLNSLSLNASISLKHEKVNWNSIVSGIYNDWYADNDSNWQ